ncbi:MAG: carbamoyltransferase [Pseudomonadales bacterium]|nr:carbamoyltransferase [Pseudomonadales bacterium]
MTYILGISAFYHDSAAAVIKDGIIKAAAQEERFSRLKFDAAYPYQAINYCLSYCEIGIDDIDYVVFYDKPYLKFERLIETYLTFSPRGFNSFRKVMPVWLKTKLFQKKILQKNLLRHGAGFDSNERLLFTEHHMSHAASAFYPSPFDEAIILTLDGVGEWATSTVSHGKGNDIKILKEIHFPHSLGLFYSAFTYYVGFKVNSGEYKLMGLAPYGKPKYVNMILEKLIDIKNDGSFRLNMEYFGYCVGLNMINRRFEKLFGMPARKPEKTSIDEFYMDIAASTQKVLETILLRMTRALAEEYSVKNLCLAGGVALNCVANGKIIRENNFEQVWVQPAAGDSGGAIGAALAGWYGYLDQPRHICSTKMYVKDGMSSALLGPSFDNENIKSALIDMSADFTALENSELTKTCAKSIAEGKVVGWFQGRMEFGPRALGNRSILADPRIDTIQEKINKVIKYRERFRPFAPSVLREEVAEWFEMEGPSPYMQCTAKVKETHDKLIYVSVDDGEDYNEINTTINLPAITHVDNSARLQTVSNEDNPLYHQLLLDFKKITGCPILVNTSFNVRGEPIVATPFDAYQCFMRSGLDILFIGNFMSEKNKQTSDLNEELSKEYQLD